MSDFVKIEQISKLEYKIITKFGGEIFVRKSNRSLKLLSNVDDGIVLNTTHTNAIANIPTTPNTYPKLHSWKKPIDIDESIRVFEFQIGTADSIYMTAHYIPQNTAGNHATSFNNLMIITDSANLFNPDSGLFVPGVNHINSVDRTEYTGNYFMRGRAWEKPARLLFFSSDWRKISEQKIGLRIHGMRSPAQPQKSLRLYAKRKKFCFSIFKKKPSVKTDLLVLRTPFSSWHEALFVDDMVGEIASEIGLDAPSFSPTNLYINGVYWGIYSLKERIDKSYFEANYNCKPDSLILLDGRYTEKHGSNQSYKDLLQFIEKNNLEFDLNYKRISELVDISNIIKYYVIETFFCNHDWPSNNFKFWKSKESPKWKFVIVDLDGAYYDYKTNFLDHGLKYGVNKWPYADWSSYLLRNLLKNRGFRIQFKETYERLCAEQLSESNLLYLIEYYKQMYKPEIQKHINRWGYPESIDTWEDSIDDLRDFAQKRHKFALKHLNQLMDKYDEH